jgi:hypothetical protein
LTIPPVATSNVSFGYRNPLKTDFLKGYIPLKKGAYGGDIKKKSDVSLEHIIPKSKGGKSTMSNYLLVNKFLNWKRGSEPLEKHLQLKPLLEYIITMLDVKTENVDGVEYLKGCLRTILKALNEGK